MKTCVSPSSIYFTDCTASTTPVADEPKLEEILRNFSEKRTYPQLQVVKKAGHYFTLNNTQLHVYRRLEETGACGRVQVVIVPASDVPEGIRNMMIVPQSRVDNTQAEEAGRDDTSRETNKGYEEVAQGETDDGSSSDESDSSQDVCRGASEIDEWSCDDKGGEKDKRSDSSSSDREVDSFI